ncbi:MAG: helix-turn-helix domain-containing protein [Lachnospiraceae bacterium]|nr:helix-turn-helix domain-containing protein [Lachnospiraceae bacterium]
MPKLKPSPIEEKRAMIRGCIAGGMARHGMDYEKLATVAGISSRTLYSRMKKPETFRLDELMRISSKLNIPMKIGDRAEDLV